MVDVKDGSDTLSITDTVGVVNIVDVIEAVDLVWRIEVRTKRSKRRGSCDIYNLCAD